MTSSYSPPPVPLVEQRRPGGGTVGSAGMLALAGGLFGLALVGFGLNGLINPGGSGTAEPMLIVGLLEICTLLIGSMVLLKGQEPGRWLVLAGCVVHVAATEVYVLTRVFDAPAFNLAAMTGPKVIAGLILSAPAIATAVLVLVPGTPRYLAWKRTQPKDDLG